MDFLSTPILAFAVAAVAVIVAFFIHRILGKTRARRHPIVGTVLHQLFNFHRLHHYMTDLASEHKTYRLLSLLRSEIYTSDPQNVEYFLKKNFPNYGKVSSQHGDFSINEIQLQS